MKVKLHEAAHRICCFINCYLLLKILNLLFFVNVFVFSYAEPFLLLVQLCAQAWPFSTWPVAS